MPTYSATQAAAPVITSSNAKPKGARVRVGLIEHPWFDRLLMDCYGSSGDAASDINVLETIVATGDEQRLLNDTAERTRGATYWYRPYWIDIYGNPSVKAAAVSLVYRGSNSGDLEDDAGDPRVVKQVDRSNMVRDPDCVETSLFTGSGGTLQSYPLGVGSVTESSNYLYLPAASGELAINTKANKANGFAVKANKKYYASLTLGQRDTGPATYTAYVLWYSMAADGTLTLLGNSLLGTHTGSSQVSHEKVVIAPASARRAVLIGYKNSGATGDLTYYSPIFRKAASADQIPDGDVTDVKVDQAVPNGVQSLAVGAGTIAPDADGKMQAYAAITWSAPIANGATIAEYIVKVTRVSGGDTKRYPVDASETSCSPPVETGVAYDISVRALSTFKKRGPWSTVAGYVRSKKTTAAANPSSVSVVTKATFNRVKIGTPSTDTDLAGYNIYFNTANNSAGATLLDFTADTKYDDTTARAAGTNCYYWVSSVTKSGVVNATRVAASGNPVVARGVAIADLNITDLNSYAENTDFALGPNVGWTGGINFIQSDPANALGPSGYVFTRAYTGAASSQGIRNAARFPVTPGQKWTIGAVAKTDASFAGAGIGARLSYRNAAGVEVATTALTHGNLVAGATAYAERQLTLTVPSSPAGIVWAILETFVYNQTAGQFWITHAYARPTVLVGMTDPTAPPAPTGLTLGQNYQLVDQGDGTIRTSYKATWAALAGAVRYELEVSQADTSGGTYTVIKNISTTSTLAEFDVTVGKFFKSALRAFSFNGTPGAQTTPIGPVQPVALSNLPAAPTGLTVKCVGGAVVATWPVSTDKDYSHTEIHGSTDDVTYNSIGRCSGNMAVIGGVGDNIKYFKIRHHNTSGQPSALYPSSGVRCDIRPAVDFLQADVLANQALAAATFKTVVSMPVDLNLVGVEARKIKFTVAFKNNDGSTGRNFDVDLRDGSTVLHSWSVYNVSNNGDFLQEWVIASSFPPGSHDFNVRVACPSATTIREALLIAEIQYREA